MSKKPISKKSAYDWMLHVLRWVLKDYRRLARSHPKEKDRRSARARGILVETAIREAEQAKRRRN
jgi:hypothetical protein